MLHGLSSLHVFVCVRDRSAQTTARAILSEWAQLFGVSRSSRPDGAFDSEVISAVSWHHTAIQGS